MRSPAQTPPPPADPRWAQPDGAPTFCRSSRPRRHNPRGQSAVEYGLVAALIGVVSVVAMVGLNRAVTGVYQNQSLGLSPPAPPVQATAVPLPSKWGLFDVMNGVQGNAHGGMPEYPGFPPTAATRTFNSVPFTMPGTQALFMFSGSAYTPDVTTLTKLQIFAVLTDSTAVPQTMVSLGSLFSYANEGNRHHPLVTKVRIWNGLIAGHSYYVSLYRHASTDTVVNYDDFFSITVLASPTSCVYQSMPFDEDQGFLSPTPPTTSYVWHGNPVLYLFDESAFTGTANSAVGFTLVVNGIGVTHAQTWQGDPNAWKGGGTADAVASHRTLPMTAYFDPTVMAHPPAAGTTRSVQLVPLAANTLFDGNDYFNMVTLEVNPACGVWGQNLLNTASGNLTSTLTGQALPAHVQFVSHGRPMFVTLGQSAWSDAIGPAGRVNVRLTVDGAVQQTDVPYEFLRAYYNTISNHLTLSGNMTILPAMSGTVEKPVIHTMDVALAGSNSHADTNDTTSLVVMELP